MQHMTRWQRPSSACSHTGTPYVGGFAYSPAYSRPAPPHPFLQGMQCWCNADATMGTNRSSSTAPYGSCECSPGDNSCPVRQQLQCHRTPCLVGRLTHSTHGGVPPAKQPVNAAAARLAPCRYAVSAGHGLRALPSWSLAQPPSLAERAAGCMPADALSGACSTKRQQQASRQQWQLALNGHLCPRPLPPPRDCQLPMPPRIASTASRPRAGTLASRRQGMPQHVCNRQGFHAAAVTITPRRAPAGGCRVAAQPCRSWPAPAGDVKPAAPPPLFWGSRVTQRGCLVAAAKPTCFTRGAARLHSALELLHPAM
jgi:hypothetical protein